jgi:hypothetical protein
MSDTHKTVLGGILGGFVMIVAVVFMCTGGCSTGSTPPANVGGAASTTPQDIDDQVVQTVTGLLSMPEMDLEEWRKSDSKFLSIIVGEYKLVLYKNSKKDIVVYNMSDSSSDSDDGEVWRITKEAKNEPSDSDLKVEALDPEEFLPFKELGKDLSKDPAIHWSSPAPLSVERVERK